MDKSNQQSLIETYNQALQAIYDHVGFVEDWVVYPINDSTPYWWKLGSESVSFAEHKEDVENNTDDTYDDEIYTQRFYQKHVYEGKDYTMVFVDTHTDGMKWFRIFDNSKRIK